MSVDWATLQTTLYNWVSASSGVTTIWQQQDAPRPDGPYIAMRITSMERVGQDITTHTYDAGGNPGEEIVTIIKGVRRFTLSLQAFSGNGGTALGSGAPMALLSAVEANARTRTRRDLLNSGKVGIASFSPVQSLDGILDGTFFEARAILECVGFTTSETGATDDLGTYISTVELEDVTRGETFTITDT